MIIKIGTLMAKTIENQSPQSQIHARRPQRPKASPNRVKRVRRKPHRRGLPGSLGSNADRTIPAAPSMAIFT